MASVFWVYSLLFVGLLMWCSLCEKRAFNLKNVLNECFIYWNSKKFLEIFPVSIFFLGWELSCVWICIVWRVSQRIEQKMKRKKRIKNWKRKRINNLLHTLTRKHFIMSINYCCETRSRSGKCESKRRWRKNKRRSLYKWPLKP